MQFNSSSPNQTPHWWCSESTIQHHPVFTDSFLGGLEDWEFLERVTVQMQTTFPVAPDSRGVITVLSHLSGWGHVDAERAYECWLDGFPKNMGREVNAIGSEQTIENTTPIPLDTDFNDIPYASLCNLAVEETAQLFRFLGSTAAPFADLDPKNHLQDNTPVALIDRLGENTTNLIVLHAIGHTEPDNPSQAAPVALTAEDKFNWWSALSQEWHSWDPRPSFVKDEMRIVLTPYFLNKHPDWKEVTSFITTDSDNFEFRGHWFATEQELSQALTKHLVHSLNNEQAQPTMNPTAKITTKAPRGIKP